MQKNNDVYSWISEKLKERDRDSGEQADVRDSTSKDRSYRELIWLVLSFGAVVAIFGGICVLLLIFRSTSGTAFPVSGTIIQRIDPFREISDLDKRGMRYVAQEDYDKAIDCFTEAIAKTRTVGGSAVASTYYAKRAMCHEAKNDLSAALADYDQALRRGGAGVDERNLLLLRLAEQEIQKGDIDKAFDFFVQSFDIYDYSLLEWGYDFNCQRRLRTYNSRIPVLDDSADPSHQYLRQADSLWRKINEIYLADHDNELHAIFSSFDQPDDNLLLGLAEWYYGQANYALALECLNRLTAQTQYSSLPPELQKACQELKESLTKLLQSGFPAGALSHTSKDLGITVSVE